MTDTFARLAELRREQAVYPAAPGVHLVVRHHEAVEVLSDPRRFSSDTSRHHAAQAFIHTLDPPLHTRVRSLLLSCGLTGPAPPAAQPRIDVIWSRLAQQVAMSERVDLIDDFVRPGVRESIGEVIGIPEGDRDRVYRWIADMRSQSACSPPGIDRGALCESAALFADYVKAQAQRYRRDGWGERDTLLTRLSLAEDSAGQLLCDDELVMLARLLCQAAIGSTSRALGNLLFELIRSPEEYRRASHGKNIDAAIEESFRHDPPGMTVLRRCTQRSRLADADIEAGDIVVVHLGSANRDETLFETPDTFDPLRSHGMSHIAFGRGPHRCPGARLARDVITAAVRSLTTHLPEPPHLVPGFTFVPETFGAWGPRRLDVTVERPAV